MNLFFTLLLAVASYAYIPEYSLIAQHAAEQHGKNSYLIEQDVSVKKDGETLTVRETWVVNGENSMRVTLEGRGPLKGLVTGSMIYDGGQRFALDNANPPVRAVRLGDDWLEPFFHFRSSKWFRNRLVSLKVAPQESLRDRAPLASEGEIKYEPPSFIRLSRTGGATAWAIGQAATSGNLPPEVWIEQDEFVLRKYRGANQTQLKADDYHKYDEGFFFPRKRSYTFGSHQVEVQTVQVKSLGKLRPDDPRFKSSQLTAARDGIKLPDTEGLREFYQRFR